MGEKSGSSINPSEAAVSSSQPESRPSQFSRRTFGKGAIAVLGAALGLGAKKAEAQVIPTNPPDSISPNPGEKAKGGPAPANAEQSRDAENVLRQEKKVDLKDSLEKQAKVAANFLPIPPTGKVPTIEVTYEVNRTSKETQVKSLHVDSSAESQNERQATRAPAIVVKIAPGDKKPASQIILEAGEQLAGIVNRSNKNLNLAITFDIAFQKYLLINLNPLSRGLSSDDQLVRLSDAAYFFDFSNYTDGISRDNIFQNKPELPKVFFEKAFAIWLSQSEQLSKKISTAPEETRSDVADVFLMALKLIDNCANSPDAFKSLGIKKTTLANISKFSLDDRLKDYFKGKGV